MESVKMIFYYNMETVYFTAGSRMAILDRYQHQMIAPALEAGNDVLVPLEDLRKVYSPDMKTEVRDNTVYVCMNGVQAVLPMGKMMMIIEGNPMRLKAACQKINGVIYVPVGQLMFFAFAKTVRSTEDMSPAYISMEEVAMHRFGGWPKQQVTVAVSNKKDFQLEGEFFRWLNVWTKGKKYGNQYRTYWMEEPGKLVPYIVYVPSTYNSEKPSKLAIFLHGGSINVGEKYAEKFGGSEMQMAAEKYNYIVLFANACTLLSAWGQIPDFMELSEQEKRYYQYGDESFMMAFHEVLKTYHIDKEHVYLMGNSMGGGGTLYLPTVHPGMFRAISAGGNLGIMRPKDISELTKIPVLITCGTEDSFGFDAYLETVKEINELGGNARALVVGGGLHLTAWSQVVDKIFTFFEENA